MKIIFINVYNEDVIATRRLQQHLPRIGENVSIREDWYEVMDVNNHMNNSFTIRVDKIEENKTTDYNIDLRNN